MQSFSTSQSEYSTVCMKKHIINHLLFQHFSPVLPACYTACYFCRTVFLMQSSIVTTFSKQQILITPSSCISFYDVFFLYKLIFATIKLFIFITFHLYFFASMLTWSRGYKTLFVLSSAELEISSTNKYEKANNSGHFHIY